MADVQKELQKLKALINQRPTAVIFASKSNESDKVSHGDAEFYINGMSKKFVFTRAGIKNPIMIDPHMKSLENVEYINGTNVEVITEQVESINELKETVSKHDGRITVLEDNCTELDERLTNCENKNTEQDSRITNCENKNTQQDTRLTNCENKNTELDERITNCEDKNVEQDMKITQCQTGIWSCESNITNINGEITTITEQLNNHTHLGFGNGGLWHFKMFEEDEPGAEGDVGWNRNLVLQYRNWDGILRIMKFDMSHYGLICTTEFNGNVVVNGNLTVGGNINGYKLATSSSSGTGTIPITTGDSSTHVGHHLLMHNRDGSSRFVGIYCTDDQLRAYIRKADGTTTYRTIWDGSNDTTFPGHITVKGNIYANNITDVPEEIINEFRVGAKQITSRESEWGAGYGLLNIAFYTDGLYNDDLSGKTILIQAAYKLDNSGPYNYETIFTVPRTINVNEEVEISTNVYFRRTWTNCYGFQWHRVPFSGSETGAIVSKAIIYEYKPGHTHNFIKGDLRINGELSVDKNFDVKGTLLANSDLTVNGIGFIPQIEANVVNATELTGSLRASTCTITQDATINGDLTVKSDLTANKCITCGKNNTYHYSPAVHCKGTIRLHHPEDNTYIDIMAANKNSLYMQNSEGKGKTFASLSTTITHITDIIGDIEIGTFCEAAGTMYDGYEKISNTDCICAVKQATLLNKRIVGIVINKDEFASHGDVLVKIEPGTVAEIGYILCPNERGYGRVATEDELIFMMMYAIPRPKITCLDTGIDGYVACFLV